MRISCQSPSVHCMSKLHLITIVFSEVVKEFYKAGRMETLSVPSEMDAAEALLELQRDSRKIKYDQPCGKEFKDNSLPMATFLYNLIGSRSSLSGVPTNTSTPKTSPCPKPKGKSEPNSPHNSKNHTHHNKPKTPELQYKAREKSHNISINSKVAKQEAVITKVWADSFNDRLNKINRQIQTTHDKATQTEIEYQIPEIESVIRSMYSKIEDLENRLKNKKSESSSLIDSVTDPNTDVSNDERSTRSRANFKERRTHKRKRTSTVNTDFGDYNSTSATTTYAELSNDEIETDKECSSSGKISKSIHNNKRRSDAVSIGEGNALIPAKVMKSMDWSSYTNATRKLLTAVFSRKVLATHSLTGKPSPAFPDKPAKKKLNSSLVNDIVQTVVEKCHVPESVVRTSITTKCADESKMFRSRQQNKKKRVTSKKRNRENIPPFNYESDDSNDSYYSS